jgi:hypothetical protein
MEQKVAYVYDVPRVLALIIEADRDESAIVADFINELLDFVTAANRPLPQPYRDSLHSLADGTTFDKDLHGLFGNKPETRVETRDAILWCLGAVLASADIME